MRRAIDGDRDEAGRLILGSKRAKCQWCGAPAERTISADGRVAWWHPPTDCCDARRAQSRERRPAAATRPPSVAPAPHWTDK